MFNIKLTVEQRVEKGVMAVMAKPLYAGMAPVLMVGSWEVTDAPAVSACTNGRDVIYGREYLDGLNDAELRFVILHECYHKVLTHLSTWRHLWELQIMYDVGNDQRYNLANVATDQEINNNLLHNDRSGFIAMPEGGLWDTRFLNWGTAKIFHTLRKEMEEPQEPPEPPTGGGGNPTEEGEPPEPPTGTGEPPKSPTGTGEPPEEGEPTGAGLDTHDWEGYKELSESEKRETTIEIEEAIRQGSKMAGKNGSGGSTILDDAMAQSKVNWRDVLREFITTTCSGHDYSTWRRPNRKFLSAGVYLPSGISDRIGELCEACDTSASMLSGRELAVIRAETAEILKTVNPDLLRVLYWDTQITTEPELYKRDEFSKYITSNKPVGGGATDVRCVPDYMERHSIKPEAVIVLTDGYLSGGWGTWTCPVLWVIIDNKNAQPDCGTVVHISSYEL
tara:strand:+ start:2531 stop:3874 length:1344 start_codon:yes stop_codon:yes gene_type:complete